VDDDLSKLTAFSLASNTIGKSIIWIMFFYFIRFIDYLEVAIILTTLNQQRSNAMQHKENQQVPQVVFHTRQDDNWVDVSSEELFAGKTVILFALPGAFTPTCSSTHLPRYDELAPVFTQHGVDAIYCLSVNDTFTMNAWAEQQGTQHVQFIPDGSGTFTDGMGMLVDKDELGFGKRSWRYSMLVRDGVIEKMFIEPDQPGDPFEVSDADTMLQHVAKDAQLPLRVSLFSKPGCQHCARARTTLDSAGLSYEVIELGKNGVSYASLAAVSGAATAPQIFIEGQHIGGADELEQWLLQKAA
jgi:glutaredoxin-like protein